MPNRIGLLLPKSTDYPAMGFDMLEGLRGSFKNYNQEAPVVVTENIGFGENDAVNYAKAEKMFLQDEVDLIIAYTDSSNAYPFYQLANALQKPFLVLDAGMQVSQEIRSAYCYHISLQGMHACRIVGNMAGEGNRKVLMATSFYDGGYRGPWSYDRGLLEAGGSVCGNYVSGYKIAEFTIDPYIGLLHQSGAASVAACFSTYLAELFFKQLTERKTETVPLPFYCSPFMAEEQLLSKCDFPGGEFNTVVPWASSLDNEEQKQFKQAVEKNKTATIFHLLGWEAGIVATQLFRNDIESLKGFSYQSPRGNVTIHSSTQHTYSPLYRGRIRSDANNKCVLDIIETITIDADRHSAVMKDRPGSPGTEWKNNYLCI